MRALAYKIRLPSHLLRGCSKDFLEDVQRAGGHSQIFYTDVPSPKEDSCLIHVYLDPDLNVPLGAHRFDSGWMHSSSLTVWVKHIPNKLR